MGAMSALVLVRLLSRKAKVEIVSQNTYAQYLGSERHHGLAIDSFLPPAERRDPSEIPRLADSLDSLYGPHGRYSLLGSRWLEECYGIVVNTGNKAAYGVNVVARFGSGSTWGVLINEINLNPGATGHFYLTGDTIPTMTTIDRDGRDCFHKQPDTIIRHAPEPSVTVDLSVTWK